MDMRAAYTDKLHAALHACACSGGGRGLVSAHTCHVEPLVLDAQVRHVLPDCRVLDGLRVRANFVHSIVAAIIFESAHDCSNAPATDSNSLNALSMISQCEHNV